MKVWKYEAPLLSEFELEMPRGAEVIHVASMGGDVYLWAKVDPQAPSTLRTFNMRGTVHDFSPDFHYLGTGIIREFVWHLFERAE